MFLTPNAFSRVSRESATVGIYEIFKKSHTETPQIFAPDAINFVAEKLDMHQFYNHIYTNFLDNTYIFLRTFLGALYSHTKVNSSSLHIELISS